MIDEAMAKIKNPIDMELYRIVNGKTLLDIDELCLYDMDCIKCMEEEKNSKRYRY